MRTPLLIAAGLFALIAGLGFGALMGVVLIGLLVGLVGAAVAVLALWGADKAARIGADNS